MVKLDTKDKVILSLDQASNLSGYSVYKDGKIISYGVLNLKDITKVKHGIVAYDEKVENVKQFLIRCIDFFKPDIVVFEDIQRQSNVKTFKDLAYLQGIIKNHLYISEIPYCILAPSVWRKELKIKGRKREDVKRNAQEYVKNKFNIEATEDESDAICISVASEILLNKDKLEVYI